MKKHTVSRLLTYLKEYRIAVVLSLLFALITVALTLLLPILIGHTVDQIVGVGVVDWERVFELLIWIGVSAGVSALSTYAMNICNNRVC